MTFDIMIRHEDGEDIALVEKLPAVEEILYRRDHVLLVTTKQDYRDIGASAGLKAFIADHEDLLRNLPKFGRTRIRQLLYLNPVRHAAIVVDLDRDIVSKLADLNVEVEMTVCLSND